MKYRFSLDEATAKPLKPHVEISVERDELAYQHVIAEILNDPANAPLKRGTLWKQGAFGWEPLMVWKRGPGWSFPDGRAGSNGMVDERVAPGA
jgi:hypothetical protein